MNPILETRHLNKRFGGLHVTNDVNFTLGTGEIHCLIGPNGAGKSTFFRLLLGEYTPDSGTILYQERDITRTRSYQRIREGISVKFQVPGIFKDLSVDQNLVIALQRFYAPAEMRHEIERLLDFLRLGPVRRMQAGSLSHGQQQWLEIAMAIGPRPKLLLLDEPTAGMTPDETQFTGEILLHLNREGMSILAVEHDMAFVRQIADQVTVLHFGRIFAQGSIDEITANDEVAKIYLGETDAA